MLLPLLGACALVGPFQGPEWEPVRGLLSQYGSCRDPRCCGNLLVLCLFLIWQIRHYWHQVNKTRPSPRKVIKVPPQERAVPSVRYATVLGPAPEFFISPGKLRGLDVHVQPWTREQRWGYRRSLQKSWAQCLLSWQRRCQGPPWGAHAPLEPIFCTTSASSTCLLPQDSSWEVWQVPWCLGDGHAHLICKPLPFALEMCQRMEQLLVHSPEEFMPLEPVVSMRSHPTSMSSATSLPNLPSAQKLQFCPQRSPGGFGP
ncbi:uncharacterized protein C22orf46 [Trichechus manatus latirostris]|uniref:Uncharacterized protein C22orf46 n=1 Tax=Trichechus manatus latirostris TaxID=127582 RepID=A0A2Y9G1A9_TRIMA|nr:uncharacterized protein C22orf46 [Trichechus manatus latirostris]